MSNLHPQDWLDLVKWNEQGLANVITQDAVSGRILMVAWTSREALVLTADTHIAHYYSRSRERLWRKGEESGCQQKVVAIRLDCDGDAVLLLVEQEGGIACHTGRESCFYRTLTHGAWHVTDPVLQDPATLYKDPFQA